MTGTVNPGPKKPSKTVVCITVLYTIFMAFYAIFGLVQAGRAFLEFSDLSRTYNTLVKNFRSKIIKDI